jgi:hypothetical protein
MTMKLGCPGKKSKEEVRKEQVPEPQKRQK